MIFNNVRMFLVCSQISLYSLKAFKASELKWHLSQDSQREAAGAATMWINFRELRTPLIQNLCVPSFCSNTDYSNRILTFIFLILYFQLYKLMWTVFRPKSPSWSTLMHSASWRWQRIITRSWNWRRLVWETVSSKQSRPWRPGRRPIARGSNAWRSRYFNSKYGWSVGIVFFLYYKTMSVFLCLSNCLLIFLFPCFS